MLSKMFGTSDLHILPVKLQLEEGHDPFQGQHSEEGDLSGLSKVKDSLMSTASGGKTCRPSYSLDLKIKPNGDSRDILIGEVEMANPTSSFHGKIKQVAVQELHALPCLESEVSNQIEDLPLGENILATSSKDGSPQVEYLSLDRKFKFTSIEHQQTNSRTTPPNFRMKKLHSIQRGPASRYLKDIEVDVDTVLMYASEVSNNSDIEMHQRMDFNLTEGLQSTSESQNGEVRSCFKELNEQRSSSTVISNEQLGVASKDSGHFIEGMRTLHSSSNIFYESDHDDTQCGQSCPLDNNIDNVNFENLSLTNRMPQATKSSQSQCSVHCPSNKDLKLIYVDQSMPVFEGFEDALSAQSDSGEMDFSADQIGFEKLNLPRNMIDRASILAKLCRSASMDTTPSDISSTSEFGGTQNIFHSVTNGLLESLDLNSTLPVNADVNKQLGFGKSLVNHVKDSFGQTPYSDCLTYSGARYGSDLRNQQASPVSKLWERLSSHTGSSEKLLSSNPDLMCFPIEEDSCISEENKDETADDVEEEINWLSANHSDKRQPLKDLTNLGVNHPPTSVSVQQDIVRAGSYDFVSTESVLTATQYKAQQSTQKQYRNCNQIRKKQTSSVANRDVRENKTLSIGANDIKKAKELSDNSTGKPNLPSKYSLKGQEKKLSLKETRRNNIVSNVNSFIPLVLQEQAAPICAGKRDVKVKALQAAETAKHVEEKRENERKIKKEALKLQRAKLNEKNLRQMELGKKRKEEERKKKDANIIAKKRLREEEERKEKEKKRMRLEATRWQREQEEKMRAEKAELEIQRAKDEQIFRKKESNESKNQQNREIGKADDDALTKIEAKFTHTGVAMNHEECGTSGDSFEAVKAMRTMDKSPTNKDLIVQKSQGSSYEISPYQCSDDEDDEYDKLPTKKYIPSWASKSFVALLLPLQQRRDPDVMFPLESCCSMDEVLLPRKLQQK
ncbi:hypothetical protein ACJIZ3_007035 [Penstemon smallii]|uniref:Inner centromere protein ARK-binding domain-containing protein n=1 Tax=Penstemon smallii TaxID=265156 RepID=A0ABD3S9F1_9LAMI